MPAWFLFRCRHAARSQPRFRVPRFLNAALLCLGLCCLFLVSGASGQEIYPLSALTPGQVGEALSVFKGDSIVSFPVEIIDHVPGSGERGLILIKALGDNFEKAGVSQGMSGSPVYLDGRWLGAIAYTFSFSREPLAYVTPAEDMLDLEAHARASGTRASLGSGELKTLPFLAGVESAAGSSALDPGGAGSSSSHLPSGGSPPLALSVAGLGAADLAALAPAFTSLGLSLVPGAGLAPGAALAPSAGNASTASRSRAEGDTGSSGRSTPSAVLPGATIGVALLRGPVSAAAFGTVSHVSGESVWAFGHPFLETGASELPLTAGRVHAVLPSLATSFKIASMTETVGTLLYDGRAGIYGRLGEGPDILPLTVSLVGPTGASASAEFEMARHERLQAALARMAVQGWLSSKLAAQGEGELGVELSLHLPADVARELGVETPFKVAAEFSGEGAQGQTSAWIESMVAVISRNPAGPLPLQSLEVALNWCGKVEPEELIGLSVDRLALSTGGAWTLRPRFRRGEEIYERVWRLSTSPGPLNPGGGGDNGNGQALAPGAYRLHVAAAAGFEAWNARRQPGLYEFEDHAMLLNVLARLESRAGWVIWLSAEGSDELIGGHELRLPAWWRQLLPRAARPEQKHGARLLGGLRLPRGEGHPRGHISTEVTVEERRTRRGRQRP